LSGRGRNRCGWAAPAALGITDDPAGLRCLTEDELAADLRLHGMLSPSK
jgi:hypothetical protein